MPGMRSKVGELPSMSPIRDGGISSWCVQMIDKNTCFLFLLKHIEDIVGRIRIKL